MEHLHFGEFAEEEHPLEGKKKKLERKGVGRRKWDNDTKNS
jgi:hypothetical protein